MQACGLVSSGVDGSPGDSLHQQLQSKGKKRESQTCEMLQNRDKNKRGNDTGHGGSLQVRAGHSVGDLGIQGMKTVLLKLPNQQVHTHRLAACTVPRDPELKRALRLV